MVNLKHPNEECFTHHFNMETIKQVTYPYTPNRYLGSLDIKDVFFSVPIYDAHEKLFFLCVRDTLAISGYAKWMLRVYLRNYYYHHFISENWRFPRSFT